VITTETPRLDSVHLRICVLGSDVRRASAAFGLDPRRAGLSRSLLYEDLTDGFSHPLIDQGIVLREREPGFAGTRPDHDDVTVFVHPFQRRCLTPFWLGFHTRNGDTLSITEDWTGRRRTTAALVTLRPRSADWSRYNSSAPGELLSQRQRRFLAECASLDADPARFTALGPVIARTWVFRHDDLDLTARRWTVPPAGFTTEPGFDVLELATRAAAEDAAFIRPAFVALVRRHGLEADVNENPVAYRAVAYLARQAGNGEATQGSPGCGSDCG
jgi:hypothetical protein